MDGPRTQSLLGEKVKTAAGVVVVGGRPAAGLGVDVPIATKHHTIGELRIMQVILE